MEEEVMEIEEEGEEGEEEGLGSRVYPSTLMHDINRFDRCWPRHQTGKPATARTHEPERRLSGAHVTLRK